MPAPSILTPGVRESLMNHFGQYISDHKKNFMERVLQQRTRHVTVVMEDIYQSQNASAVVRTCECMGVQDIHIVENASTYAVNPKVLKGSNKWLNLIRYKKKGGNNTQACFDSLREAGYRIAVTNPSPDCVELSSVPLDRKLAIVMGNELDGASKYALANADLHVTIPMFGFTESYNISVSAAICLNTLVAPLRTTNIPWELSDEEKNVIRLQWYRGVVRRSDVIEREFLKSHLII